MTEDGLQGSLLRVLGLRAWGLGLKAFEDCAAVPELRLSYHTMGIY